MAEAETWLDKVRAGQPIEQPDWNFLDLVIKSKAIEQQYNAETDFKRWGDILRGWWGKVGDDVVILPTITVDFGFNIEIGDRSFLNVNCTLLDTYPIRIGADVKFGPNCALYPVGHPLKARERAFINAAGERRNLTTGAPIVIEDDVWLGGNVIVMPGVTIGARSVIGAGSVVTKSIPPDVFAAGNPCRVVKPIDN